jgi:hypothetical protein
MLMVLIFFGAGCFLATLHFSWWLTLPRAAAMALNQSLGNWTAIVVQIVTLLALTGISFAAGYKVATPLWPPRSAMTWRKLLHGRWPLLPAAVALALLNWATLLVAGHPWGVTWVFTLWSARSLCCLDGSHVRANFGPAASPSTRSMVCYSAIRRR